MFIFKHNTEHNSYNQRIGSENKPGICPALNLWFRAAEINKLVYYPLRSQRTNSSPKSVSHYNEKSLSARTYGNICFFINELGTGNIKEVESHSIYNHGKNKHPYSTTRITKSK